MYGMLDISVSGMIAQRTRMQVIQANIANMHVVEDAQGNYAPYLRKAAMLAPGDPGAGTDAGRDFGVHVAEIAVAENALVRRYDPASRHADSDGYVMVPDINPVVETINAMEASRAYEANVASAETSKAMLGQMLRLVA